MDSFSSQGYLMDPEFEYGDAPVPYTPIGTTAAYGYSPGVNGYHPGQNAAHGQSVLYLPQTYGQQEAVPVSFQIPREPASASRRGNTSQQLQHPSSESDSDRHAKRIKRTRTACEECRKRKQKCDGGECCQPCEEQGTDCKYRDVPPTKKDDTMEKMLQIAETYNKTLATLNDDVLAMNTTLRSIEARLNRSLPAGSDERAGSSYAGTQQARPRILPEGQCAVVGRQKERRGASTTSSRSS